MSEKVQILKGKTRVKNLTQSGKALFYKGFSKNNLCYHGTDMTVGGFHIVGTIVCLNSGDIQYDMTYTWNDIIDPNPLYVTDIIKNAIAERFFRQTMGANYME